MKKFIVGSAIAMGIGALIAVGFLVAIGVEYRQKEDSGIEPGYTPDFIVGGFEAALWLCGIGLVALVISSVVAFARRTRGHAASSAPKR